MIGRKVIIQFLGVGLSSFLSFLTLSATARFFGANTLGEINYYLGILGLTFLFSDFGFSRAHIKFVAEKNKIGQKIGVFLSIKFILLFFSCLIAFSYFLFFLRQSSSSYKTFAFLILLFYEFFNRAGSSILLTFEGLQLVVIENFVLGIGKLAKLFGVIVFLFLAKDLIGLSLAYLLEGLLVLTLAIIAIRRFLPISWERGILKNYFYYSLPFFVIYPLSYIQGNINVVILRNFWNASAVGYYSAAVGLSAFLKSLYGILMTLFFPKMSQLFSRKEMGKMQQYIDSTVKYFLIIFVPILLGFYFFRNEFVTLVLGGEFKPAVGIFSLSLLAIFILMISSPYDHLLYATGRHQILAPLTILTVFLAIILQLILVPKQIFSFSLFGLAGQGVVLANIIAWFLSSSIQIYLVYRFFKIKPYFLKHFFESLSILIFSSFELAIFSLLKMDNQPIIWKVIFLALGLPLFYILLKIFKVIESSDVKYLKLILNPRRILKEALTEVKEKSL